MNRDTVNQKLEYICVWKWVQCTEAGTWNNKPAEKYNLKGWKTSDAIEYACVKEILFISSKFAGIGFSNPTV